MSLKEFAKYRSRSFERKTKRRTHSESLSSSSSSSSSSSERRRRKSKPRKKAERKDGHTKKHAKDVKHKRKKRSHSRESSSSSDSYKRKKKSKHKHERKRKKKEKNNKKNKRKTHVESKDNSFQQSKEIESYSKLIPKPADLPGPLVQDMHEQPKKRSMAPMTKEEYEQQQSKIRRVFDSDTGRHRLIKGDGEVIEEIVSYDRHKIINKMATHGDGVSFQANLQKQTF